MFAVKFYCVQHSGLQKLTRPSGGVSSTTTSRGVRDVSDYSKPSSLVGPGMNNYHVDFHKKCLKTYQLITQCKGDVEVMPMK